NKDVIHRERQFDEETGQELEGVVFAAERFQPCCKEHRQREPDCAPAQRLLETDHMGMPMKAPKNHGEKEEAAANETSPVPRSDCNQTQHTNGLRWRVAS